MLLDRGEAVLSHARDRQTVGETGADLDLDGVTCSERLADGRRVRGLDADDLDLRVVAREREGDASQ
jgi:hypothetical protein